MPTSLRDRTDEALSAFALLTRLPLPHFHFPTVAHRPLSLSQQITQMTFWTLLFRF